MAASVKKMVGVSDDSSSSDDETLKRCQEAVWETRPEKKKGEILSILSCCVNSVVVADHEHDGNELQVSKGFRTHVAKKLGHFLDSDSDSEMEARLKEAAVSVKDLLPSSTPPSTLSPPSTEPPCSEKIKKKKKKKMAEGEESHVVKKKKKRKQNQEESAQVDCVSSHLIAQNNSETGNSEQEHTQVKVKQKKKKKREGNTGEEALN
uniref:Protein CUSTOS n=1 Tax=Lates calcarifer TaxID=8187 RepID=A0A4W6F295_LATCA